jgi:hypothetical protein
MMSKPALRGYLVDEDHRDALAPDHGHRIPVHRQDRHEFTAFAANSRQNHEACRLVCMSLLVPL